MNKDLTRIQAEALAYIWGKNTLFIPKGNIEIQNALRSTSAFNPMQTIRLYRLPLNANEYLGLEITTYNSKGKAVNKSYDYLYPETFFKVLKYCDVYGGKL